MQIITHGKANKRDLQGKWSAVHDSCQEKACLILISYLTLKRKTPYQIGPWQECMGRLKDFPVISNVLTERSAVLTKKKSNYDMIIILSIKERNVTDYLERIYVSSNLSGALPMSR